MKGKVLKLLKTKYAKLGLSKEALEALAATIEQKLTDESSDDEIEAEVNGVENLLKVIQSDSDKRVTDAANKAKGTGGQDDDKSNSAAGAGKGDEPNDLAKAIQSAIAPLVQQIASLQSEKVTTNRKQLLEQSLEKVDAKIKAKVLKDFARMSFEKEEDFESYLEETVTDLGEIGSTETKVGGVRVPPKGGKSDSNKPTEEEIKSVVDSIM